jgi:hypothetical protein
MRCDLARGWFRALHVGGWVELGHVKVELGRHDMTWKGSVNNCNWVSRYMCVRIEYSKRLSCSRGSSLWAPSTSGWLPGESQFPSPPIQ